jgi:hypothetical protein
MVIFYNLNIVFSYQKYCSYMKKMKILKLLDAENSYESAATILIAATILSAPMVEYILPCRCLSHHFDKVD